MIRSIYQYISLPYREVVLIFSVSGSLQHQTGILRLGTQLVHCVQSKPAFKILLTPREDLQVSPLQSIFSLQTCGGGVQCTMQAQTAMCAVYCASLALPLWLSSMCCSLCLPFSSLSLVVQAHSDSRRPYATQIKMMGFGLCAIGSQFSFRSSLLVFWCNISSLSSSDSRWALELCSWACLPLLAFPACQCAHILYCKITQHVSQHHPQQQQQQNPGTSRKGICGTERYLRIPGSCFPQSQVAIPS